MQFAVAEVSGTDAMMRSLRQAVCDAGPYEFIKLSHHASYNGFDESLLEEWSPTVVYATSGGINDPTHPDPGVLRLLEEQQHRLTWARTDRNGMITITFPAGEAHLAKQRGELNDSTPNGDILGESEPQEPLSGPAEMQQVRVVPLEGGAIEVSAITRLAPDGTLLSSELTIQRATAAAAGSRRDRVSARSERPKPVLAKPLAAIQPRPTALGRLADGRRLPKLLFVTSTPRLANNIGAQEAAAAIALIRQAGQTVYEVRNPAAPYGEVQGQLRTARFAGIVVLGGYDVLPAQRLDVLPSSLRQQLGASTSDADNFIVWSDDVYGDLIQGGLAEIPVSRIPDGKSPRLVYAALTSGLAAGGPDRFGVRNAARPFADGPYGLIPGTPALLVSAPTVPGNIGSHNANGACVYYMLHGSDADGARFWGEDQGAMLEAVDVGNVPVKFSGVVFTGCCWGALTVQSIASQSAANQPLGIRTTGTSMALSYLRAGARAFIGCTGAHYSPTVPPYGYFGGPMHSAFWKRYTQGTAPAQALLEAKKEYLQAMPHGLNSPMGQAIEFKILKQYTCLGLGW